MEDKLDDIAARMFLVVELCLADERKRVPIMCNSKHSRAAGAGPDVGLISEGVR